jgi:hypothetical protein
LTGVDKATRAAIIAARASGREKIGAWRAGVAWREIEARFADCPAGDADAAMARAAALLADDDWARRLVAPLVTALAADPLFEPPLKVNRDALRIGAVLFDCPAVSISACRTSAAAMQRLSMPATIAFSGRVAVTRYIRAGGATLRRWRTEPAEPDFRADAAPRCTALPALQLTDGAVIAIDGRREAQLLVGAESDVVTIVATIRAGAAPLMREHAIDSGQLLRVASGDDRASRAEMLLAFLRLSGRADAGPRFDEACRDAAFHLRWAAMREWLALDARAALPRLEAMADDDPHDGVRAAASRTLTAVRTRLAACPA